MWRRWIAWLLGRARRDDSLGSRGEAAAENFLREKARLKILARNWRCHRDEIDLVARDKDVLVFIEVKTRPAHALVSGYYAVDRRKKRALLRACRRYVGQLVVRPRTVRFDIVEVVHRGGVVEEIRHFENVPLFPRGFCR